MTSSSLVHPKDTVVNRIGRKSFFFFFNVDHFLKSLFCFGLVFCFFFFGRGVFRILVPQPGSKPAPPALEGGGFTTGLSGKFQETSVGYVIKLPNLEKGG